MSKAAFLKAYVSNYEDIRGVEGEFITVYIIQVEYAERKYALTKRYSDFANLYSSVQEFMNTTTYKFPNKSIFNNNAQFTKERRLRGFDELIRILVKINRNGMIFLNFLEIFQEHKSHAKRADNDYRSGNTSDNGGPPSKNRVKPVVSLTSRQPINEREDAAFGKKDSIESEKGPRMGKITIDDEGTFATTNESYMKESGASSERSVIETIRNEFPKILQTSIKASFLLYSILLALNAVEFSSATIPEIFFTWFALTILFCYIFVISIRNEARIPVENEQSL